MKKIALLIAFLLLIVFCSCSSSYYLYTSPETKNDIIIDRGNEYQIAISAEDNLTFIVEGLDTDNGDNRIIFSIFNGSTSSYSFKDSQISIYGGNAESNEWSFIQKWNATEFYDKTKQQSEREQIWADVAGAISVASAALGSASTSSISSSYGNAVITTRSYNASDVALTAMSASIYSQNLLQANKANLKYLKENLLYSSTIKPGESYLGIIYFPGDRKYADYKIVFEKYTGKEEFIFSKSIRKEILHPWTTDSSRDLNAITLNFSPFSDRLGLYYYWLPPKGVGIYTGFSVYEYNIANYDIVDGYYDYSKGSGVANNFTFNFNPNYFNSFYWPYNYKGKFTEEKYIENSVAFPVGMTIKIAKHSWLLAGITTKINLNGYSFGKLEYSINNEPYKLYSENVIVENYGPIFDSPLSGIGLDCQLGANFVFNYIDFGLIINYDIFRNQFAFDLSAGVAL